MSVPSADLADAGRLILAALDTPEGKAVLLQLVEEASIRIESRTTDPFLKGLEAGAFSLVEGYLSGPATAQVTPIMSVESIE